MRAAGLAAVAAVAACKRGIEPPPPTAPPDPEAAQAFAEELAAALQPCDPAAIARLFDFDSIARRALVQVELPRAQAEALHGWIVREGPAALCAETLQDDYALLHVRDGGASAVYRLRDDDDGVNYQAVTLGVRRPGDPVRAVDLYMFLTGQWLTEEYADRIRIAEDETDEEVSRRDAIVTEIDERLDADDLEGARRAFERLPAEMREQKSFWPTRLELAMRDGEAAYLEAFAAYQRAFPNDGALDLLALDGLYLREDWSGMLAGIDRLDQRIGGDPRLDGMRVEPLTRLGRHPEAVAAARRRIEVDPAREDSWWALVGALLGAADHPATLATFDEMERRFGIEMDPEIMATDGLFEKLVASPAYAAWLAARPAAE